MEGVASPVPPVCVAARLPSAGTLLGDAVARHDHARVTAVAAGWHDDRAFGQSMDMLALVEGLPDAELAGLLLAWGRRYGRSPEVLGESFALRLPVAVDAVPSAGMQHLLHLDRELPLLGSVAEQDWIEQWFTCRDRAEAEKVAGRLRQALLHVPGAEVRIGSPRHRDLDCWEVLSFASGVVPPLEA